MPSIVRTRRAFASGRIWGEDEHLRHFEETSPVPLVDPSDHPLPGINGSHGVRCQKPDGSYLGCDFIWLRPSSAFPMHKHEGDHILYIIEGRGFVHIDGRDIAVRAGHVIHIPAEHPHRVWTADSHLLIAATGHPHKEVHAPDRMSLA